jgi:hypothetical protein
VQSISEQELRMGRVDFGGIVKDVCLAYVPEARAADDHDGTERMVASDAGQELPDDSGAEMDLRRHQDAAQLGIGHPAPRRGEDACRCVAHVARQVGAEGDAPASISSGFSIPSMPACSSSHLVWNGV